MSSLLPRRNILGTLAGLVALPGAVRADDREDLPYTWMITDQLGQHFRLEVYARRPSEGQSRNGLVGADRTGRAWLVISDAPPPSRPAGRP